MWTPGKGKKRGGGRGVRSEGREEYDGNGQGVKNREGDNGGFRPEPGEHSPPVLLQAPPSSFVVTSDSLVAMAVIFAKITQNI